MPYEIADDGFRPFEMNAAQVVEAVKREGVKFIDLQFADLPGRLNHITIPSYHVTEEDLAEGYPKIDGSSIRGYTGIGDSDMMLKPDPNTFAIVPWSPPEQKLARMIGDVYMNRRRGRYAKDPRAIAQAAERYLRERGFSYALWGPELELFILDRVTWDVLDPFRGQSYSIESREAAWNGGGGYPIRFKEGYHPTTPQDTLLEFRNECSLYLAENFHVPVEAHHHEVATAGQVEFNVRRDTLTSMADGISTVKYVAKNVAHRLGRIATAMPKPIAMDNGSGMHVHVSLWHRPGNPSPASSQELDLEETNLFYDESEPYAELSQTARYFIGGLLEHSRSLASIVAPTTNSYHRLVPGFEAPVYIAWSRSNRSANIRIPTYITRSPATKRIEFRTPDASCNPYLTMAAILAAGLDGLGRSLDCGDPVDGNIYELTPARRRELGIRQLPGSLKEAVEALQSDSEYLRPIFPKEVLDDIVERELKDHMAIALRPHPYEFYMYFDS